MGERTYEGVCEVRYGPDGGALRTAGYPAEDSLVTLVQLVMDAAGVPCPSDSVLYALEREPAFRASTAHWVQGLLAQLDAYRQESGRQYPPVYRVRLRVDAEALSDADTAAYWQAAQTRAAREAGEAGVV